MKTRIKKLQNTLFILLMIALLGSIQSCQKETSDSTSSTGAIVNINMLAAETSEEYDLPTTNSTNPSSLNAQLVLDSTIAFAKGNTIDVKLNNNTSSENETKLLASTNKAASQIVNTVLVKGIQYKLLVYDSNGNFVVEKNYTYGNEAQTPGVPLDAGKTYTFVVYSINSTTTAPTTSNQANLSTATIANVSADLMYFKNTIKLNWGNNNLNVILKHQFSQVTTVLHMDPNMTGNINAIIAAVAKPTRTGANLRLADGSITYNTVNTAGANIIFPSLGTGVRQVTSSPTLLINPVENAGTINLGSITIDGETKINFPISGLKIKPGSRYTLDLTFKTCTQDVAGADGLDWNYPEVILGGKKGTMIDNVFYVNGTTISKTITAPGADYGFVFDIVDMDNAFNMEVNGVKLATQEIQFQKVGGSSIQNIKFADGSIYEGVNAAGGSNIGAIYNLQGTTLKPLVKVVISRTGVVTMFGSKTSGGTLYPLVLTNGNTFNTFPWNSSIVGTNTVKITQLVDGRTVLKGYGSGKKKISCSTGG
ncbi:fimbrillin family protein [Sphingobacterium sp. SRCM116780]|uniref:fimbrillin family protein n=1 Tax=Sphingobacterium sp. SRCM116780 TaxID=2907623 RepID=UPI001F2D4AE4|nr:fimbrillin family protein [Sphingobacterium sp. SRCM116780]UIR55971.1 fimbrillin family protein [Sphingobacterium sp. SRCM116780]